MKSLLDSYSALVIAVPVFEHMVRQNIELLRARLC